jgi:hypothetical protein
MGYLGICFTETRLGAFHANNQGSPRPLVVGVPRSSNVPLFRAVQEGSFLVSHLYEGEEFLKNEIGYDLYGHIRRVAISYQINQYCLRGDLPFVTEMKQMPRGPLHWLEIKSTGATAHVCRTDEPFGFPDAAESRQDYRLMLQADLLSWIERGEQKSLGRIVHEIPQLYAWLTFHVGAKGQVNHLCWVSPAADVDEYIGYINVLDEIARSGDDSPSIAPTPDPKEKLRFKDHIAEQLEKSKKPGEEG